MLVVADSWKVEKLIIKLLYHNILINQIRMKNIFQSSDVMFLWMFNGSKVETKLAVILTSL